jgi:hypothetical protein
VRTGRRRQPSPHHTAAAFGALSVVNAGAVRRVHAVTEYSALLNTILALLAVVAVMAVHAVCKLLLLPFRVLRDLSRYRPKPARVTAG